MAILRFASPAPAAIKDEEAIATSDTTRQPRAYRVDPDFRFKMRLAPVKGQERVQVTVYRTFPNDAEPGREYLTPEIRIGKFVVFARNFLVIESPPGGWTHDSKEPEDFRAKQAIIELLALSPDDKNAPKGFFDEHTELQKGFLRDNAKGFKFLAINNFES